MVKLLRVFKNFSGGLSEIANDNMRDDELAYAQNAVPGGIAGLARCKGTSVYQQVAAGYKVKKIVEFTAWVNNSEQEQLISFLEGNDGLLRIYIKALPNGDWTAISAGGGEDVVSTFPAVKSVFMYGYTLYFIDGEAIWKWNGTILEQVTAGTADQNGNTTIQADIFAKMEKAVAVVQRGQRWFYAVGKNELLFTEIGLPTYVGPTNIININTNDGDKLTALHLFNENLLVFKQRSVFQLSGWDFAGGSDLQITRLNVTTGTEWPDTVKTVENAIIFLGINGLYRLYVPYYSSIIATQNISNKKISDRLFANGDPVGARAVVWNNIYYLSVDYMEDGGLVNREYRYYLEEKSFWGEFTQGVYAYTPALLGDNKLYIGAANGYILYYDENSDHYVDTVTGSATSIPMVIKTKGYDVAGAVFQDSKVKRLLISAKQYDTEQSGLVIQIKADYADEAMRADIESIEEMIGEALDTTGISFDESLIWAEGSYLQERWGWSDTVTKQIPIGRKTKHMQFILKSNEQQPLIIYALGLLYKKKKVKGNSDGVEVISLD